MYKRKIEPEKKIEAYQREEGSAREIMKRLKISKASFQKWVRNYNTFGRNGLPDKAKAKHYPKEVKTTAVQESLSGNTSLAVIRRKRPIYRRSKPEVTAENILNRDFSAETVNEKWCTDVTKMKYSSEGEKAYLSAVMGLKSRDIVSFAIGKHNNNLFVFDTFDLAVQKYPDAHPLFIEASCRLHKENQNPIL